MMFGFDDYFYEDRDRMSLGNLPYYNRRRNYKTKKEIDKPVYNPQLNEYSFSGSHYYPEYNTPDNYAHLGDYQPEDDYYNDYNNNKGYNMRYGTMQQSKSIWQKKEDEYKKKLKDLGHDISFNKTPSDEFIEMLLMENSELKEFTPLNKEVTKDSENITMSFEKSKDNIISFDILASEQFQQADLIDELTKMLSEFVKGEEDYLRNKSKGNESDVTEKEEEEINNITQILASDSIVDSEVPLGYSKMEIDESDYEVVDIQQTKKVRFDDNIKYEDAVKCEDKNRHLFPGDLSPLKQLFGF